MNINIKKSKVASKTVNKVSRHWMTLSFFLGFIVDNLTLNRVDQVFDNLVLLFYVLLAMISMLVLYASVAGKIEGKLSEKARKWAPLLVQYSFGGLLSGMLIFYGRSGDWSTSWPFMLIILLAVYGNETIKDRASRMVYNISILFVGLFSYTVLVIPVLTGKMGALVFLTSGFLAVLVIYGFMRLLYLIVPNYLDMQMKSLIFTIGSIFIGLNTLYFTNIIPPIPLSLKDVGIYHSVVHFENGDYQLKYEEGKWWQFFKDSDKVFHPVAGDNVFCFAKVFAPTRLATDIYHTWEYKDENGKWIEHTSLSYSIAGGRSDGYRGYTLIQNFSDGEWRCSVETGRGQVLGKEVFKVDSTKEPSELVTIID